MTTGKSAAVDFRQLVSALPLYGVMVQRADHRNSEPYHTAMISAGLNTWSLAARMYHLIANTSLEEAGHLAAQIFAETFSTDAYKNLPLDRRVQNLLAEQSPEEIIESIQGYLLQVMDDYETPSPEFDLVFCRVTRVTPARLIHADSAHIPAEAHITEAAARIYAQGELSDTARREILQFGLAQTTLAKQLGERKALPYSTARGTRSRMTHAMMLESAIAKGTSIKQDGFDYGRPENSEMSGFMTGQIRAYLDDVLYECRGILNFEACHATDRAKMASNSVYNKERRLHDIAKQLVKGSSAADANGLVRAYGDMIRKHGVGAAKTKMLGTPHAVYKSLVYDVVQDIKTSKRKNKKKETDQRPTLSDFMRAYREMALAIRAEKEAVDNCRRACEALDDFKIWRRSPEAITFLKAEANSRRIKGNIEADSLMAPVQRPKRPILSLPRKVVSYGAPSI